MAVAPAVGELEGPELVEWADIVIVPSWPQPVVPSTAEFRGRLDLHRCPDPDAFERANYIRALNTRSY